MIFIADGIPPEVERIVRKVLIVMDQVLVTTTPVDTGRARANWIVTLGGDVPEVGPVESGPPGQGLSGQRAAANAALAFGQGRTVIDAWTLQSGTISIVNNLSYISFLEDGSSAQAPVGMLKQALQAGIQSVAGERVRIIVR